MTEMVVDETVATGEILMTKTATEKKTLVAATTTAAITTDTALLVQQKHRRHRYSLTGMVVKSPVFPVLTALRNLARPECPG